jgi:hypothetical protein
MANTDQSGSASERRAQERQQRQRREEGRVSALNKGKKTSGRGPTVRKKDRTGWYMGIGVAALIAAFIVVVVILRNQPASTDTNPAHKRAPADQTVVFDLTSVPQATWEAVGKGSVVKNAFTYNGNSGGSGGPPPLTGAGGLPQFLYVGGEFCPYCGAERWAMINALSRFGTFSKLSQIQAYEYNVPTFSFYGSNYTSPYVDFVPREVKGNELNAAQTGYTDLEKLTPAEQATFQKFDSAQNFPFVDIGNRYTGIGASYDFTILLDSKGNALSWQTIASSLKNPKSTFAQGILGTANYMTAGICSLTNQQPGTVCNSAVIQQIEQAMRSAPSTTPTPGSTPGATPTTGATSTPGVTPTPSKTSKIPGSSPLAIAPADLLTTQRRVLG